MQHFGSTIKKHLRCVEMSPHVQNSDRKEKDTDVNGALPGSFSSAEENMSAMR